MLSEATADRFTRSRTGFATISAVERCKSGGLDEMCEIRLFVCPLTREKIDGMM